VANRYWVGGTGAWTTTSTTVWSATSGGASGASVPTATDSVFFDQAGTRTITLTGALNCLDITVSAGTHTFTSNGTINIRGSMSLLTGTVWSATGTLTFSSTTTGKTITTNAVTINSSITFNGVGGAWILQDALTMGSARILTHTNGTLDLNGKTLTVGIRYVTAAGTKNLTFNGGTLVCPTSIGIAFNNAAPTNFTTTAGTGTGVISMAAPASQTFEGGGSTYNCTLNRAGSGLALIITGANTFNDITNTVQPVRVQFTAGTTTTFNNFNLNGTAGNLVTIESTTASTHTLSKASGTVTGNYLSITNSTATGGATWNAGANSIDGGGNTGWIFASAGGNTGAFFSIL